MYEETAGHLETKGGGYPRPRPAVDREDEDFQDRILHGVSRTFALTIPQLPHPLDRAVTNAYLLCRIADTIEDDPGMTSEAKDLYHSWFLRSVEGIDDGRALAAELVTQLSEATIPAEHELIAECPRVLRITHSLPEEQRSAIQRCVSIMSQGMAKFEQNRNRHGLADVAELESYCYVVAGVVGEMLTELFCSYSPEIARHRDELTRFAVRFGQGLQMTNILKDVWDDLERDTCWLPRDIFEESGFDLSQLQPGVSDPAYCSAIERLVGIAHSSLRDAISYTLLIPRSETGIRRFLLWAIGLAVLTLQNIHSRPGFSSSSEVKISRRTVTAVLGSTNTVIRSNLALRALYGLVSRGLPVESARTHGGTATGHPSFSRG